MSFRKALKEIKLKTTEKINYIRGHLTTSLEGRIFLVGIILAVLYSIGLAICGLGDPQGFQEYVAMTATHILFGRAAAMSFGYTVGLGHNIVVPINMLIETILVLLFYPLFVFSIKKLVIIRSLSNILANIHAAAEAHHATIRRYGVFGLFLFVLFPFWMTGPVVGCAIGYLLGLRPVVNLSIVLGGTYAAIGLWAVALKEIHEKIAAFNPFVPMIMVFIIILIAIMGHYLRRNQHKK
jgi:uncharacterized membrane protein